MIEFLCDRNLHRTDFEVFEQRKIKWTAVISRFTVIFRDVPPLAGFELLKAPLDSSCLPSAFYKSLQDMAISAFVVGKMWGRDKLSLPQKLPHLLSDCPGRKKDHCLRGCTFKNTCSLQVIVVLQCVQHFGWAQYKVQWFRGGRSGGIQQIQNYLFL